MPGRLLAHSGQTSRSWSWPPPRRLASFSFLELLHRLVDSLSCFLGRPLTAEAVERSIDLLTGALSGARLAAHERHRHYGLRSLRSTSCSSGSSSLCPPDSGAVAQSSRCVARTPRGSSPREATALLAPVGLTLRTLRSLVLGMPLRSRMRPLRSLDGAIRIGYPTLLLLVFLPLSRMSLPRHLAGFVLFRHLTVRRHSLLLEAGSIPARVFKEQWWCQPRFRILDGSALAGLRVQEAMKCQARNRSAEQILETGEVATAGRGRA
jgi:hypothetical protein